MSTFACATCAVKYSGYIKIEPCRSLVALTVLRAQHGTDFKAFAEALHDQIRVRVYVYKTKAADLPIIGSGSSEGAMQRLVIELRAVVAMLSRGARPRRFHTLPARCTEHRLSRLRTST